MRQYTLVGGFLDTNQESINIDITNYLTGLYNVTLVCDGQIIDIKSFLKQ